MICSIGIVSIVFITLFVETILTSDQQVNKTFLVSLGTVVVSLLTTLTLSFFRKNIKIVYKILFVALIVIAFASIVLYCFAKFGLLDKFDSVEEFRQYVDSFGTWTEVLFVIIQFLQVVVLPVPSFITVGAGVLLYGPLTRAEGDKQAMILEAEGERDARIARAEGEAQAVLLAKKAEADGIRAIIEANPTAAVIELKRYEALVNMAQGQAAKIIVPTDVVEVTKKDVMFSEATGLGDATAQGKPKKSAPPKSDPCCD